MPQWEHRVSAALRPYVTSCVGYDHRMDPAAVHHGVPSTGLTVVLAFDAPLDCGWPGAGGTLLPTLVAGLHTTHSLIRTHGRQCGIQLAVSPVGCRALFGMPASAVAGEIVSGDEGRWIPTSLRDRMEGASWPQRFRFLEEHLTTALAGHGRCTTQVRPEVDRAWQLLCRTGGRIGVDALAGHVGFSRRRLLTLFRAEFGLAPSEVARVARFGRSRDLLATGLPLVEIAARAGYADQPHLTREWRRLSGTTPARWRKDGPFVQDDTVGAWPT